MKYPSHYISKIGKISTYILLFLCITTAVWASGGGRRSMGVSDVLLLPRVWIGAVFCLAGIWLLMKSWVQRNLRLVILGVVFFTFGILPALPLGRFAWGMGMHPSPVRAITKPFFVSKCRQRNTCNIPDSLSRYFSFKYNWKQGILWLGMSNWCYTGTF